MTPDQQEKVERVYAYECPEHGFLEASDEPQDHLVCPVLRPAPCKHDLKRVTLVPEAELEESWRVTSAYKAELARYRKALEDALRLITVWKHAAGWQDYRPGDPIDLALAAENQLRALLQGDAHDETERIRLTNALQALSGDAE